MMAWEGSTRRQTLGKDYFRNRAIVMRRDGKRCQIRIPGLCTDSATDCDHIGDRLDHRPENMRAACRPCHLKRSGEQGGASAGRAARTRAAARWRTPEPHPGLIEPGRKTGGPS